VHVSLALSVDFLSLPLVKTILAIIDNDNFYCWREGSLSSWFQIIYNPMDSAFADQWCTAT